MLRSTANVFLVIEFFTVSTNIEYDFRCFCYIVVNRADTHVFENDRVELALCTDGLLDKSSSLTLISVDILDW